MTICLLILRFLCKRNWCGCDAAPIMCWADSASILDTYRKLHEGKIGAHWLWCVIEQIAAGVSEEEALKGYGYYSTAPAVYRNAVLEESAQAAEQATFRRRQARSWANAEPVQPCEVAAAIREIKSSKEEDHAE